MSPADYGRLSKTPQGALFARRLTRREAFVRIARRTTVPLLALFAALLALAAALAPGPSEATRRQAALRESIRPVDTALTALIDTPARVREASERSVAELQMAERSLRQAAGGREALTAVESAHRSDAALLSEATAAQRDAAVLKTWRAAALKRGPATDSTLRTASTLVAALAALAAAIVAFVKVRKEP